MGERRSGAVDDVALGEQRALIVDDHRLACLRLEDALWLKRAVDTGDKILQVGTQYMMWEKYTVAKRLIAEGKIAADDLDRLTLTDDVDHAVALMVESSAKGAGRS